MNQKEKPRTISGETHKWLKSQNKPIDASAPASTLLSALEALAAEWDAKADSLGKAYDRNIDANMSVSAALSGVAESAFATAATSLRALIQKHAK